MDHSDRCDRCGAQAFVRSVLTNGELLWCGHHYEEFKAGLESVTIFTEDHRDKINQRPSLSANAE